MVGVRTRKRSGEGEGGTRGTRQRLSGDSEAAGTEANEDEGMHGFRLEWIELKNFKSYAGVHRIGPFDKGMNAIIGPNGSGKSNVMDAIAFVLGSKSKDLRCTTSFKDLVHTPKAGEEEARGSAEARSQGGRRRVGRDAVDSEKASVTAMLVGADQDTGGEVKVEIERTCNTRGTCYYRVNGRTVTWEAYRNELRRAGVLSSSAMQRHTTSSRSGTDASSNSASNPEEVDPSFGGHSFLFVFQGEVDSLAARNPKELCRVFEQASGSILLKDKYEELVEKKRHADERLALAYSKKRGIAAEKRDIRAQKEEAERYLSKASTLEKTKRDLALSKLYFQAEKLSQLVKEKEAAADGVAALSEEAERFEKELNESRLAGGKIQREMIKAKKTLKKLKSNSERGAAVSLKHVEGEITQIIKRLRANESKVKQLRTQHTSHLDEVKQLEEQVKAKEEEISQFEIDLNNDEGGTGEKVKGKGLADEYNTLKAKAGKQSVMLQQEKAALERRRTAESDSLLSLESDVRDLNHRLHQLGVERDELDRSIKKKQDEVKDHEARHKAKEKERRDLNQAHKKNSARRDQIQSSIEEMSGQMREAKSYRKEKERDARMLSAINNLKESVSGVHGRLSELCTISESKYTLAITVALGKNMDAVVVDDVAAAKECIQWLKSHFLPPMMFLPLKTIKAKPINEKSRNLGGTSKLAYDIVQFSPQFERVVRFVCGNTLVCDKHKEAKDLAYGGRGGNNQRHKVVTADGTLIDRSGTITGGRSQGMERLVQRWNEAHVVKVKKTYEKLSGELKQLPSLNRMLADEQENLKAIEGLQQQIQYGKAEVKALEEKRVSAAAEIKTLEKKRKEQIPTLNASRSTLADLTKEAEGIDGRINAMVDEVFRGFSTKVGVQNIREYEETQLRRQQEAREKRLLLSTDLSKVQSQLEYERKRDTAGPLKKMEHQVAQGSTKLEKLKKKEQELGEKASKERDQVAQLHNDVAKMQEEYDRSDEETRSLKKQFLETSKVIKEHTRKVEAGNNAIEQRKAECEDILQNATIDHIELPTVTSSNVKEEEDGSLRTLELGDKVYSFASLDRQVTRLSSSSEQAMRKFENDLKDEIQSLQLELEKENPNLKAAEQYNKTVEQEKDLVSELEAARDECDGISREFQEIKGRRHECFMKTFDAVASSIDSIYKELTTTAGTGANGPEDGSEKDGSMVGGTAYLSLENPDDPFLGGIKYTAMPPSKRFRDLTDLSGGEKTVAALALLFALNLSCPSRAEFFVLDEIDAALDSTNVGRVAHFLHHKKDQFQTLVISLKDTFYDKADALHGVCRNPNSGFSQAFSLDLNQFAS